MRHVLIAFALLAAACGAPPATQGTPATPANPAVAAERAFAADAQARGWVEASEASMAAEAIVFQSRIEPAAHFYANIDRGNRGDTSLVWGPDFAGVAASDDLGFTAGVFNGDGAAFGTFLTVWKKQADGSWKWLMHDGVNLEGPVTAPTSDAQVTLLPPSGVPPIEAADAAAQVREAEATLAVAAARDARAALAQVFTSEGRLVRDNHPVASTGDARNALLMTGPQHMVFSALGVVSSEAGDLAYSYGTADWPSDNRASGYYTRIWQRRAEGWRLVYDQILPR